MSSKTIFFDGFGPWGGSHVGEIDPLFWETTGTVTLSEYRTDRSSAQDPLNLTYNGLDFQGYSFGAVAKLANHNNAGTRATLVAKNFPTTFLNNSTGFGVGFFVNKITTDSVINNSAASNYPSEVISLHSVSGVTTVDILTVSAVHLSTLGYSGVTSPKVGLKVTQGSTDRGTFTFDVFGSPWYVETQGSVSTTKQRTISAYDYKYGGLYVEVCVVPDIDSTSEATVTTSGSTSSGSSTVTLVSTSGLSVGMGITNSSAFPSNTRILSIDAPNNQITLDKNTTQSIPDATSIGFTTKVYSIQIKVNGMNLTNSATVDGKKIYIEDNFTNNGVEFFNKAIFYGARMPDSNSPFSATHLYDTYIDNIYIIEGDNEEECLLGPTTKVFNVLPKSGGLVNSDWQPFNLVWNTNTSIEENLIDSNGDTSYVYTETSGSILAMPMALSNGNPIPSGASYAVGGIKITNSVRKSNRDTSFQNVWGTGTLTTNMSGIGTNFSVTNNHYEYKNQYFLTNPVSNANWTFDDVINGKFGIKKTS